MISKKVLIKGETIKKAFTLLNEHFVHPLLAYA